MLAFPAVRPSALLLAAFAALAVVAPAQVTPPLWSGEPSGGAVVLRPPPAAESTWPRLSSPTAAGPVALHPHAVVRLLHGEGFALASLPEQDTSILTAEPGLLARLGRRWRADYTATWIRYSNRAFADTLDSALTLAGEHAAGFWRLQEQARFESSTSLLMETAAQTRTRRRGGNISLERDLGRGRLLETGLEHSRTQATTVGAAEVPIAPSWTETAARARFTRRLTPELHTSALLAAGRTGGAGADSRYVRPGLGMRWQAGERLQLGAEISRETRSFTSSGTRVLHSTVTGLRGEYSPAGATRLTFEAARTLSPSFSAGEINRQSLLRAGLRQRLLGQVHFDAAFLRRHHDYLPVATGVPLARTDRSRTFDFALSSSLLRRISISLLHRSTRNDSSFTGRGFRSRQYGAELNARF